MLTVDDVHSARRDRLVPGAANWWFLGPGGIAKVRPSHLDPDGELTERAAQRLRAAGLYDAPPFRVYSLTVLTSTDCNLGCGYCFQNTAQDLTGGSRPPRIKHARLTSEMIGQVLDFTGARMAEAGLDKLSVMLFGGEPLLNLKGCKELLSRAADYGMVTARMISNAVLLTPLAARELHSRGLRSIQITLDGDEFDHDQIRVRRSGGGTFETILNNVVRCSEAAPLGWELRVNVSHLNRAGIDALIERVAARVDPARCALYFTRVGDVGVGFDNELLHESLADDFIRWNRRTVELGFQIPRPRATPVCQACSFRNGQYGAVVNPDGVLYSCWETSGKPGWEIGTTESGYRSDHETEGRWATCESQYHFAEEEAVLKRFHDQVDGALLDALHAAGKI